MDPVASPYAALLSSFFHPTGRFGLVRKSFMASPWGLCKAPSRLTFPNSVLFRFEDLCSRHFSCGSSWVPFSHRASLKVHSRSTTNGRGKVPLFHSLAYLLYVSACMHVSRPNRPTFLWKMGAATRPARFSSAFGEGRRRTMLRGISA